MIAAPIDRQAIHDEMEQAKIEVQRLLAKASAADLKRRSDCTRWTNQQLLFHMVFGYMIVRALLGLVRVFGRLPDRFSKVFAAILNSTTPAFHVINYLGSSGAAMVFRGTAWRRRSAAPSTPSTGTSMPRPRKHWAVGCTFPSGGTPTSMT